MAKPIEVFISYAPEDHTFLRALERHLAQLQRDGLIETWHQHKIGLGGDWRGTVGARIEAARIILLLVSADFIASDDCFNVQVTRAMEKHAAGTATVIPVLLRPCDWQTAPFASLLPDGTRPVSQWTDCAEAFTTVARAIRALVEGREVAAAPRARPSPPPGLRTDDRAALVKSIVPFIDRQRAGLVGVTLLAIAVVVAVVPWYGWILIAVVVLALVFARSRAAGAQGWAKFSPYAWMLMLIVPVPVAAIIAVLAKGTVAPRPPLLGVGSATGRNGSVTTRAGGDGGGGDGDGGHGEGAVRDDKSNRGSRVVDVAAGGRFTCARKQDGTVWCWGGNDHGALGVGESGRALLGSGVPLQVEDDTGGGTLQRVVALASGYQHACAVTIEGSVWCWGSNVEGELGNGSSTDSSLPVRVFFPGGIGFLGAASVACGEHASCAIMRNGALYCWGSGTLGAGGAGRSSTPVGVPLAEVRQVAIGASGTICARDMAMGDLYCWGDNSHGEVGNVDPSTSTLVVTPLKVRSSVTEVRLGYDHTCAVDTGAVFCWGADVASALGVAPTGTCPGGVPCSPVPARAPGPVGGGGWPSKVIGLGAGQEFTCALTEDGAVYCWGAGSRGSLGNGSMSDSMQAVRVLGAGDAGTLVARQISVGCEGTHACALQADGTVACWGDNTFGQLGDGTMQNTRSAPVLVPPF